MNKNKLRITFLLLFLVPIIGQAEDTPPPNRITFEKARKIAIHTYSGKIQSEELEFEDGKWIYTFDVKKTKDKLVHEIHVDAISGKMLKMHTESDLDEVKEQKEDDKISAKAK